MGTTVACLPAVEACMAPPGTMNAGLQEGDLEVSSSLQASDVHGVFSNGDLASTMLDVFSSAIHLSSKVMMVCVCQHSQHERHLS